MSSSTEKNTRVSGTKIKKYREEVGLLQRDLAEKIGVDKGTISRWERGKVGNLRGALLGRLCNELKVDKEKLQDSRPDLEEIKKGQMNVTVSDLCRTTLELVGERYGVTRQQIIEAAPLLFYLVAEQSLRWRRQRLEAMNAAIASLQDAVPKYFPGRASYEDICGAEEESIEAVDIFGKKMPDEDIERNPFDSFLSQSLSAVTGQISIVLWYSDDSPYYHICHEEADRLVGGDTKAKDALVTGLVGLHDMPPGIRRDTPKARAEWVQAELARRRSEGDALLDSLFNLTEDAKT